MAIDTLAKRNSVVSVNSVVLPIPDSTIGDDDRQTLLRTVGSILADTAAEISGFLHRTISLTLEHIGF